MLVPAARGRRGLMPRCRAVGWWRRAGAAEQDFLEWLLWVESGHLAEFLFRSHCQAMTIPTPQAAARVCAAQHRTDSARHPASVPPPQIIFCAATPAPGLRPLVWVNAP